MGYDYEQEVPYCYIKHKKPDKAEFTDDIKIELDKYYHYIKALDNSEYLNTGKWDKDAIVRDLGERYRSIRTDYIIPFAGEKYKDKLLRQELDFLFVCSHTLYMKFKINQTVLNDIWGIDGDKLERLDWYPQRSFAAYYSACDNTMKPNDTASKGALIAKCINQNIQARYMCCAFTGITNDLDLFANLSFDKNQCFILTHPMFFKDDDNDSVERANYSLARMLFASGNMLYDGEKHAAAGSIVRKIGDLLNMKISLETDYVLDFVERIISSGKDISEYAFYGKDTEVAKYIELYRSNQEIIDIYNQCAEREYIPLGIEYYDEHFGASEIDASIYGEEVIERISIRSNKFEGDTEELVTAYAEKAIAKKEELIIKIFECLDSHKLWSSNAKFFDEWISVISNRVKNKFILSNPEDAWVFENDSVYSKEFEEQLCAAASYWIAETFKDGRYSLKDVEEYLATNKMYLYFDALAYVNQKRENKFLYAMDESGSILEELRRISKFKEAYPSTVRPQLIYVDMDAHSLTQQDVDDIRGIGKVVLVVRDLSGEAKKMGLKELDKELNLYYTERG